MEMNKPALKEAITDTAVGAAINVPLNILFLWLAQLAGLSIVTTGVLLSAVFTVVAIVRKYYLRTFFEKRYWNSKRTDLQKKVNAAKKVQKT